MSELFQMKFEWLVQLDKLTSMISPILTFSQTFWYIDFMVNFFWHFWTRVIFLTFVDTFFDIYGLGLIVWHFGFGPIFRYFWTDFLTFLDPNNFQMFLGRISDIFGIEWIFWQFFIHDETKKKLEYFKTFLTFFDVIKNVIKNTCILKSILMICWTCTCWL